MFFAGRFPDNLDIRLFLLDFQDLLLRHPLWVLFPFLNFFEDPKHPHLKSRCESVPQNQLHLE